MLRRSSVQAHSITSPISTGTMRGKQTPHGPQWGFQLSNERMTSLGPGDFSTGYWDPQWKSPFVDIFDNVSARIRTACYKMNRWADKLNPNYPREDIYRLRRIMAFGGVRATIRDNAFIAPSALVVGDVLVGRKSTIGYNAVVRGDTGAVKIGESACINDKVVIYGPAKIGKWATIDPMAVVDNADVASCSMVGSASIVNPGCRIESGAMLCAASNLRPGTTIPSGEIWSGNPAMKLGTLTDQEKGYIIKAAKHMVLLNLEHTATWEITWEDHENYRLSRETWALWAADMIECRVKPYYSRAGPKDSKRPLKSPLEHAQGRLDGGGWEAGHIEGGNKGINW